MGTRSEITPPLYRTSVRDATAHITKKRSPLWPRLERSFRKTNPTCAICGSKKKLNVHHKKPFHLFPELELDPTNLVTLCMDPAHECHLKIGHGDDFQDYNPDIVTDIEKLHTDPSLFNSIALMAKEHRLNS